MRVKFLHIVDPWHRSSVTVNFAKEIMVLSIGSYMWLLLTNPIKESAMQCHCNLALGYRVSFTTWLETNRVTIIT